MNTYVGYENATILVVAYDEPMLLPLLMKAYKSSLPFVDEPQTFESLDGGSFKDLFHTTNTTTNTWIKIVGKELYDYHQYHVFANICKCVLIWWQIKEHKFLTIVSLAKQILGILANQIEIEWIFSIANILIALCKCCL
jgi:hypothetical protein